jgi:hypothetical protein
MLGASDGKIQIVIVNGAFHDDSTETLLLLRSNSVTKEYPLDVPNAFGVDPILGEPSLPMVRAIPYQKKIAFLADFGGTGNGVYFLDLPLRSGAKLQLNPVGSPEFNAVATELKTAAADPTLKQQFCQTGLGFASFYEKHVGSCGWPPEDYANNRHVHNYSEFWGQN